MCTFPANFSKMAADENVTEFPTKSTEGENSETSEILPDGFESQLVKVKKRSSYLQWDEYFMAVAFLSAQRSKDPNSQVGACIVNVEKKIVGIGYNGMPNGCSDDILPWARHADDDLDTKYPYVCHAEMNAILNKNSSDVKGCTIYVALFPCNECAKLIIQSGIKKIVYLSDKYHHQPNMKASRKLLTLAKVEYIKYVPENKTILVDFTSIEQPSVSATPQKLKTPTPS